MYIYLVFCTGCSTPGSNKRLLAPASGNFMEGYIPNMKKKACDKNMSDLACETKRWVSKGLT